MLGVVVLLVIGSLDPAEQAKTDSIPIPVTKLDSSYFPAGFYFGSAVSAFQVEGAANKFGKGPSIWDTFAHEFPEMIEDGSNADVAVDFYHQYKDDVKRMSNQLGMNAFRFSISWPRVIPTGKIREGINEEGVAYYNALIDELKANGVEPFITLFHWDLPQGLQDKYGGFTSPNIVDDFKDYAEFCFKTFGDRVKHWITINEPLVFTVNGYDEGKFAPGRCSSWVNRACLEGNSATEPYIVGHHLLLAHAAAVKIYKEQEHQNGQIGITLDVTFSVPFSNSVEDIAAARRNLDFSYGWFIDPLTYGHYPRTMQEIVGDRLPKFTEEQVRSLKGSCDFIGLNYYTSSYVSGNFTPDPDLTHVRFTTDNHATETKYRGGTPIGLQGSPTWLYIYPDGILHLLNYTKVTYRNPPIFITENGIGDMKETRNDLWRISYHEEHLLNVLKAICDGANVKGYFAWSFINNYEWNRGFTVKMGLFDVDDKLVRRAKLSVHWFKKFLSNKPIGPKCNIFNEDEEGLEDSAEL